MSRDRATSRLLRIFLCHSTEDKETIRKLYQYLSNDGFKPWVDEEDILPGQNWREEIPKAVREADIVLVCLSRNSTTKSGYVQKEIKLALDIAEEQPENTIYIIPVKLEECEIPERLESLQTVNLFSERGYERLIQSLRHRAGALGVTSPFNNTITTTEFSTPENPALISVSSKQLSTIEKERDTRQSSTKFESYQPQSVQETHVNVIATPPPPAETNAIVDLAIEIGKHQTRIQNGHGVVLSEPSIIAINKLSNTVKAIGKDAEGFLNSLSDIVVFYPMEDNKVADSDLTAKMLQHFISKICNNETSIRARVVVAIPSELTPVERRAFVEAAYHAKADEVYLVERILCAAVGAGLLINGTYGNMVIYVSESATEVMVISHGRPASFKAINEGTNMMEEAITAYIERKYNLRIGKRMAEIIRMEIGSAFPLDETVSIDVHGHNLLEGMPKTISISDEEVREALADTVATIVNVVRDVLQQTPPELSADIVERGIVLTGDGARLKNLDLRLKLETNLSVSIPEDPLTSVVSGATKMLSSSNLSMEKRLVHSPELKFIKLFDGIMGSILSWFSSDLAIDIGAKNTLVYAKGTGIVVAESSIVAVNKLTYDVEAIGIEAKQMMGRTPSSMIPIHPIKNGVIFNFDLAVKMLKHFITKAHGGKKWVRPRVVIPVRSGLSKVERNALEEAAYNAKASKVYLVEEAMCAAIGAGLPIMETHGNMIVDIGGSATDIAVISFLGIAYSQSVRVAGNEMDEAITQFIKRKYNLLIGERTAEAIKIELGSAFPLDEPLSMEIRGRSLMEGMPKTIFVSDEEIREALADSVATIVKAVRLTMQKTSPELASDIVERGIMLMGGGALLKNMDKRLSIEIGIPVSIADDPLSTTLLGAGRMLSDFGLLKQVKWDQTYKLELK